MDLNSYQDRAMSYRMESSDAWYALLNLSGEVGELHSLIAKGIRDRKEIDKELLKKEIGDILWCVAAVAKDSGFTLGDVAYTNIAKLTDRKARNVISGQGDCR